MNHAANIPPRIDETLAVPLYHQVYLVLKENVRAGVYPPDTPLPPEAVLCEEFNVSRITIKRAMRKLVDDGLVVRQRGRGTFVSDTVRPPATPNALDDLLQTVQAIGEATDVRSVSADFVSPSQEIATLLRLDPGERVLRSNQLRLSGGDPLAVIAAYVPEDVAANLRAETENLPMLVRLKEAGVDVTRADQEVTATLAEPAVAVQLGIEVGAPLLKLTRLVMDETGRPVEWLVSYYRGDRYAMRTSLTHEIMGRSSAWKTAAE
jgi:GntR family transcriptional regulator